MLKKIMFLGLGIVLTNTAMAGWLIQAATINYVGNTWDPSVTDQAFYVNASGTGPCANQTIYFPVSASNPEVQKRAFTIAMTAYIEKKRVYIYNYKDDTCSKASMIQIVD